MSKSPPKKPSSRSANRTAITEAKERLLKRKIEAGLIKPSEPDASPGPDNPPPQNVGPDANDLEGIPDMPQEMIDAWHDDAGGAERTGYGNPPKHGQFPKGKSGNPSGKRKKVVTPVGNVLQNIGHEVIDEATTLLLGDVRDLQVRQDDRVTTAIAKIAIGDGLKKDGAFRKFVLMQFIEKPINSERLTPVDPRAEQAQIMQKILYAITDPGVTDDDYHAAMQEAADHHEAYGEFGARRRKERRKRRRKPSQDE